MPYRAKRLPPPVALVGSYRGGNIFLNVLIAMGGVRALFLDSDINASFQIVGYTIMALRDKEEVFNIDNTGAQYSEATLNYLKNLKSGDRLLFTNIICKWPDEKDWKLNPLEYTITE